MELKYNIEGKELYKLIGQSTHNAIQKEVAKAVKSIDVENAFARIAKQKCESIYGRMTKDGRLVKAVAEEVAKKIDTEKIINEILQDKTMFFDRIVDATTGVLAERIINIVVASYIKKQAYEEDNV